MFSHLSLPTVLTSRQRRKDGLIQMWDVDNLNDTTKGHFYGSLQQEIDNDNKNKNNDKNNKKKKNSLYSLFDKLLKFKQIMKLKFNNLNYWTGTIQFLGSIFILFGASFQLNLNISTGVYTPIKLILIDFPILLGSICFLLTNLLAYLEVLNSPNDFDEWCLSILNGSSYTNHNSRRIKCHFFNKIPDFTRIDTWIGMTGMFGSLFYVGTRIWCILQMLFPRSLGIPDIPIEEISLMITIWIPFTIGSLLFFINCYLSWMECTGNNNLFPFLVWNHHRIDQWVCMLYTVGIAGFTVSCMLSFIQPFDQPWNFVLCAIPYWVGSFLLFCAALCHMIELEMMIKKHTIHCNNICNNNKNNHEKEEEEEDKEMMVGSSSVCMVSIEDKKEICIPKGSEWQLPERRKSSTTAVSVSQ